MSKPIQEERRFSVKEVSELLRVSKRTIYKYLSEGLLPYYKLQQKIYIKGSDLIKFENSIKKEVVKDDSETKKTAS